VSRATQVRGGRRAGRVLAVGEGYTAAKIALGLTALLALALVAMALFDAPWIGFVAMAALFGVLIAREVFLLGVRGFLVTAGAVLAVIAVAFAFQRLA
jgi:hypothetical protein